MMFYSTTVEVGCAVSDPLETVGREDSRASADQDDLIAVWAFVTIGLLLTATFLTAGSFAELGQILAASG